MKFRPRRSQELEEGESYYVSMTDMMVGVVFIFIIMLSYFALQFRTTTATLTQAKDAQTTALMQIATNLTTKNATVKIDTEHHVVCIPGSTLSPDMSPDEHCFAYSDTATATAPTTTDERSIDLAKADQSELLSAIDSDLQLASVSVQTQPNAFILSADDIFLPGTTNLSPSGEATVQKVAQALTTHVQCFVPGGGDKSNCDNSSKLSVVNVSSRAGVDATTQAGRDKAALVLERSSAFYLALLRARPELGNMKAPSGAPLLHVSSGLAETPGQSQAETITIQFQMATHP